MRLTLRTLLAYLDEILEPEQAEQLSQKIRESDFASGLVHRIRNSMGRLRISSPAVHGTGLANDANTVAQYLDNQLPGDRVSEFEKICLESDMHLAEVASCHQILTLVLGEPAEVSEPLRARMYAVPHQYESLTPPAAQAPPVEAAGQSGPSAEQLAMANGPTMANRPAVVNDRTPTSTERPWSESTEPRKSTAWIPASIAIFLLGVASAYFVLQRWSRPVGGEAQLAQNVPPNPSPQAAPAREPNTAGPVDETLGGVAAENSPAATSQSPVTQPPVNQSPVAQPPVTQPPATAPAEHRIDAAAAPPQSLDPSSEEVDLALPSDTGTSLPRDTDLDASPADPESTAPMIDAARRDAGPVALPPTAAPVPPSVAPTTDETDAAPVELPSGEPMVEADRSDPAAADTSPTSPPPPETAPVEPPINEGPQDYGRFLLSHVAGFRHQDQWMRIGTQDHLFEGMQVRVPVAFDPPILVLGGSISVTLGGRSEITILPFVRGGVPHIEMPFGRAIFSCTGREAKRVAVTVGQRELLIAFDDPAAEFAMEVGPYFMPGDNPSAPTRSPRIRIWPSTGRIVLEADGTEIFVKERQTATLLGAQEPVLSDDIPLPDWVDTSHLASIEEQALLRLKPMLDPNQPLPLTLAEIVQSNASQSDLKSLAMRALASFDRFGPLVESLDQDRMHAYWTKHVEELQAGVARGAAQSRSILQALQASYGPEATVIHEMLTGYSPQQLEGAGGIQLVEALAHEELPYRVVAAVVLRQITGKTHLYEAKDSASRRRPRIAEWEDRLRQGDVRYVSEPAPLGLSR